MVDFLNKLDRWRLGIAGLCAGFVVLHFMLLFGFPMLGIELSYLTERTWGYHFIRFFSFPVVLIYYLIVVTFIFLPLRFKYSNSKLQYIFDRIKEYANRHKILSIVGLCLGSFVIFWFFRVKYPLLGDHMLRVKDSVVEKGGYASGLYHYWYVFLNSIVEYNSF